MDLSSVVPNSTPPRFVNSQLVSLPPVGILNKFLFYLYLVFVSYTRPHKLVALNVYKYSCFNFFYFFFFHTKYFEDKASTGRLLLKFDYCENSLHHLKHTEQIEPVNQIVNYENKLALLDVCFGFPTMFL